MSNIIAISAICGEYKVNQKDMKDYLNLIYDDKNIVKKYNALLKDESILYKRSVIPDFLPECKTHVLYKPGKSEPDIAERMSLYQKESVRLGMDVSNEVIKKAGLNNQDITHIITVSCTGFFAPGLETVLTEGLGLDKRVKRYTVNFMGCYAAFQAMRLADLIARSDSSCRILMVCVELCSMHFRKDNSDDNLLSTFLFSDGAAACVISKNPSPGRRSVSLCSFNSLLIPEGKHEMAWYMGNNSFEMILSRNVPVHIEKYIAKEFFDLISNHDLSKKDIAYYAIHPGGKSILEAYERALVLPRKNLSESYEILQSFGNMSSATIFFVLKNILDGTSGNRRGWIYSAAFGPGLTIESGLFKMVDNESE